MTHLTQFCKTLVTFWSDLQRVTSLYGTALTLPIVKCKMVPSQARQSSAEFLVIALSFHRKSLLHHATHSIIACLWGASIGSTDSLVHMI